MVEYMDFSPVVCILGLLQLELLIFILTLYFIWSSSAKVEYTVFQIERVN